jgi:N-acetylglutamate synthase-like GNAT family acetyltransferase
MTIAVAERRLKPDPAAAVATVDAMSLTLRQATADDAPAIHALIVGHLAEGRLLPRQLGEISVHAHRFVVAVDDTGSAAGRVVGCVDVAPLSRTVAEVRSLVVSEHVRSSGIGRRLIDTAVARAGRAGFERLCAFTHVPSYFVQLGFSLVPHEWLPEKIQTDCSACTLFRRCRQYAVVLPLARATHGCVPLASLHG